MSDRQGRGRVGSGLFGGWLAIYLVIPFIGLAVYVAYHGVGSAPGVLSAAYISAATATITTLVLAIFGIPFASYLAHSDSGVSRVARLIIRLPLGIPPLVSGIMLLIAFGPYSAIGRSFGGRLVSSMAAIVLAQLFVEMPFVIEGARSGFSALSPEVFEVSYLLGIPNWRRIVGVELPLSIKTVRTAVMMGWLRAFGEFGATVLVAYHPTSLPVMIFAQFSGSGLSSAILPVGAVLVISSIAVTVISRISTPSKLVLGIGSSYRGDRVEAAKKDWRVVRSQGRIEFEIAGQISTFRLEVSVSVDGRSLSITGPSGAGKSLTLRSIVGLPPRFLHSFDLAGVASPKIAYVPQGQGLFDHLNVYSQLAIAARWAGGLRRNGEIETRIREVASQVGIGSLLDRMVSTLSGGQRQRVALARAIVSNPDLLILDEPFSALDRFERDRQIRFVRRLVADLNLYLVVVTHDITEAAYLSESLAIIDKGTVIARGSVGDLLKDPGSVEVAQIMGYENILPLEQNGASSYEFVPDSARVAGIASAVFKSSSHRVLSWSTDIDNHEERIVFEVEGPQVIMKAVSAIRDCIDLGTHRTVILGSKDGATIELDLGDEVPEIMVGAMVETSLELDPRSTSIIPIKESSLSG